MDTDQHKCRNLEKKRGVAILLVVGLIAMLMITASAFCISMRIERRAAATFKHQVQAKHMLYMALSEAVDDISEAMTGGDDYNVYPPWDSLESDGTELARVFVSDVTNMVPEEMIDEIGSASPKWKYVYLHGSSEGPRGRYAFIALNCSGFLDANVICTTNRGLGASPGEIQITGGHESDAIRRRDGQHVRYESMKELAALNSELYEELEGIAYVQSLAYDGSGMTGDNTATNKIVIGGTVDELNGNAATIQQGLQDAGISAGDASFVFNSLIDYIDEDCHPHDVEAPYVEAVPMVNEIALRGTYGPAGSPALMAFLQVEHIYPFLSQREETFEFQAETTLNIQIDGGATISSNVTSPMITIGMPDSTNIFCPVVADYDLAGAPPVYMLNPVPSNSVVVSGSTVITVYEGGTAVDKATVTLPTLTFDASAGAGVQNIAKSTEVGDARFNWQQVYWREHSTSNTLGSTNAWTMELLTSPLYSSAFIPDDTPRIYVADSGRLNSVGELGNILPGRGDQYAFSSIRLYDDPGRYTHGDADRYVKHDVLRVFCTTNGYRRGLVNINTSHQGVLEKVFVDVPVGDPSNPTRRISETEAETIATAVTTASESSQFRDISDIASVPWTTVLPDDTDVEREMVISSSAGLMTTRQNIFLIVLTAESFASFSMSEGGTAGKKLATARALAEVWRDPYEDEDGNHKMLILSVMRLSAD